MTQIDKEKIIITDVDGVLLDWVFEFGRWMDSNGIPKQNEINSFDIWDAYNIPKEDMIRYIKIFNETVHIGNLSPIGDAIKYVKKLHRDHGFVFHAITAQSDDINAQMLRVKNIHNLFGKSTFQNFIILDCRASKESALERYRDSGCYWIEDNTKNAILGADMGLESILMSTSYNHDCTDTRIERINSWKDIYDYIYYSGKLY